MYGRIAHVYDRITHVYDRIAHMYDRGWNQDFQIVRTPGYAPHNLNKCVIVRIASPVLYRRSKIFYIRVKTITLKG